MDAQTIWLVMAVDPCEVSIPEPVAAFTVHEDAIADCVARFEARREPGAWATWEEQITLGQRSAFPRPKDYFYLKPVQLFGKVV
jgi:hypothetical protein